MIEIKTDKKLSDLREYVYDYFSDRIHNIEEDFEYSLGLRTTCYTFEEDDEILGFICVVFDDKMTFMSYTLAIDNKIKRDMYKHFKKIHAYSKERGIPVVTDGTNFGHCKNHVEVYGVFDGITIYEWKL